MGDRGRSFRPTAGTRRGRGGGMPKEGTPPKSSPSTRETTKIPVSDYKTGHTETQKEKACKTNEIAKLFTPASHTSSVGVPKISARRGIIQLPIAKAAVAIRPTLPPPTVSKTFVTPIRKQQESKVVIRLLPPSLTWDVLKEALNTKQVLEAAKCIQFIPGHCSSNPLKASLNARCYLHFENHDDALACIEEFHGYTFVDEHNEIFKAVTCMAPFQKTPKAKGVDKRNATIETHAEYIAFLQSLNDNQAHAANPSASLPVESIFDDDGQRITPLILKLREKRNIATYYKGEILTSQKLAFMTQGEIQDSTTSYAETQKTLPLKIVTKQFNIHVAPSKHAKKKKFKPSSRVNRSKKFKNEKKATVAISAASNTQMNTKID